MKQIKQLRVVIAVSIVLFSSCSKSDDTDVVVDWDNYRESTSSSSASQTVVFEYTPAPGQFINQSIELKTALEASDFALGQFTKSNFVSLGGFGGYIIVGFDHSIPNRKALENPTVEYDFSVKGNPFEGSSEPGIVYVMQDVNGNGKPDDVWYELKGAEHGAASTISNYEVTYTKPNDRSDIKWSDNKGAEGSILYTPEYHAQRTYYPTWINEDSYTLKGVRLESNVMEVNSSWFLGDYGWGYADDFGDNLLYEGTSKATSGFQISNAVDQSGSSVELNFIDFIKVQCAVNANAGRLGGVSTEIFGFTDLHISVSRTGYKLTRGL